MKTTKALAAILTITFAFAGQVHAQVPRRATATATVDNGVVKKITIEDKGLDYEWTPNVTITGGGGTGAVAQAFLTQYNIIDRIEILAGGNGYTSPPQIEVGPPLKPHDPRTAIAGAAVKDGAVTVIQIADAGFGYIGEPLPSVQLIGGGGSGAVAIARAPSTDGALHSIEVQNGGSGYITAPQVVIESPVALKNRKEAEERARMQAEAQAKDAQAKAEAQAQAEAEAHAKADAQAQAEMQAKAARVKSLAKVAISLLVALGSLWFCRTTYAKKLTERICKQCGCKYSIWSASLGAGLCNACREAEKKKRAEEAAKHTQTASPPPASPKANILFYYKVKDEEKGPYTLKQLTSMWENGQITADARYRTSDSAGWLPLLPLVSEPKPVSQPTNDSALAQNEQTAAPSGSMHLKGWYKKAAIAGGIALLAICGFALLKGVMGRTGSGGTSGDSGSASSSGIRNKTGRQLIQDYAEARHGRRADVDISSGYFGGAYTVTVSDHENFHTYTYAVEVDEKAQRVTAWQLTASH